MPTWTTPKTDWQGSDSFSASDWLRIVGNAEYIADELSYTGFTPFTNVTDGQTLLTAGQRTYVTKQLYKMLHIYLHSSWNMGYVADRVNFGATWNSEALNIIESMERDIKAQLDGELPQNDFYRCGDELCCGDTVSVGLL